MLFIASFVHTYPPPLPKHPLAQALGGGAEGCPMSQKGCLHKGGTPRASNPPSPALPSFRGRGGPMLTDSGGYQIFSMGYGSVPGPQAVVSWAGSVENIVTRNTPVCFPVAGSPKPQPFKILLPFVQILCFCREFPPVFLPVVFFLPS